MTIIQFIGTKQQNSRHYKIIVCKDAKKFLILCKRNIFFTGNYDFRLGTTPA